MNNMWPKRVARALVILMATCLAACGGGGGGSSGSASTDTSIAPTGSASTPLVLTGKNGVLATLVSTSYGELTVALGELTVQWASALQAAGAATRTRTCSNGGTETLSIDDLDGSGTVSQGDVLQVRLDRCYSRWVDAPMSGTARFQWTSHIDAADYAGLATFGDDFALVGPDVTLNIAGTLILRHAQAHVATTLQVSSYDVAPLAVTWHGQDNRIASAPAAGHRSILAVARPLATSSYRDTLQRIDVSKRVDLSQARVTTEWQLQLSSELLGGQLNVRTATPTISPLWAYPLGCSVWITGANNARLTVQTPDNSANDGQASLSLDVQGDGQTDYVSSLPWAQLSLGVLGAPEDTAADEAAGSTFVTSLPHVGASYLMSGPPLRAVHNVVGPLRWQFSAPVELEEGTQLVLYNVAQNGRRNPWGFADWSIPLIVTHYGAFIELIPTQPLEPGSTYRLANYAAGNAPPRRSIGGGSPEQWDYTITTDDLIQANVSAAQPGVVSAGMSASLHASHAYTGTAPLTWSWRQVSGPLVVLSSATEADVTVNAAVSGGSNGDTVLELRVQTPDGDVDLVRVKLPVIGDPLHSSQALFSPPAGFDVSTPGSTFLASHRRDFVQSARVFYGTANGTVMQLTLYSNDDGLALPYRSGTLMFGLPSGTFSRGTYTNVGPGANLSAFVEVWPYLGNCSPDTGIVSIHEIETGPNDEITRLALDFDRNACTGVETHAGSVRINSDRPLKWQ